MASETADAQRLGHPEHEAGHTSKRPRKSSPRSASPVSNSGFSNPSNVSYPTYSDSGMNGGNPWLGANSTFRSLSTCNRCRLRKHRCDQRLPVCSGCEKAGARCTGYDPVLKREVPRSYVYFLEHRVAYLENLLENHHISYDPPDPGWQAPPPIISKSSKGSRKSEAKAEIEMPILKKKASPKQVVQDEKSHEVDDEPSLKVEKDQTEETIDDLVGNIGMVPVQGTSSSRYLGTTSGISFARVVFAAIKSSVNSSSAGSGHRRQNRQGRPPFPSKDSEDGTSMRDSFFGLDNKPTIKKAPFPDHETGLKLVNNFFEHANPMYPILHREEFMKMFENAYSSSRQTRTPRESYMLNIVFAIGKAIFLTSDDGKALAHSSGSKNEESDASTPSISASGEAQAEEYHASAAVHLESVLNHAPSGVFNGFGGGLEELQAVLLLALFAILRPVAPGLWYIIGVAVRLAVDLGLHHEDGPDEEEVNVSPSRKPISEKERGRREYVQDMRRRLWWCVYSLDRLVSGCVGRPVGISDQVITTEFPSLLDDKYISRAGLSSEGDGLPSYKYDAHHYFGLRLLQSEILEVLQHQHAWQARARQRAANNNEDNNPYMTAHLSHPFLENFTSFRSWRADVDARLQEWRSLTPTQAQTGVAFSLEFFELKYWLTIVMLYRQSLSIPPQFEGEFNTADEVGSPTMYHDERNEDKDMVFLRVAEAGRKVLRLYRQLHHKHLFNYTYLDTHHLFMSGIAYLYAIWHSPIVRSRLTMEDVDFTVLAATSVLTDLIEKCPPAEACRDAFKRMSNATIQMCLSSTGFGSAATDAESISTGTGFDREEEEEDEEGEEPPAWVPVSYDQQQNPGSVIDETSPTSTFSRPQPLSTSTATDMPPPPLPALSQNTSPPARRQRQSARPKSTNSRRLRFEGLDFLRDDPGYDDEDAASTSTSTFSTSTSTGAGQPPNSTTGTFDPFYNFGVPMSMDWESELLNSTASSSIGTFSMEGVGSAGGDSGGEYQHHLDPFEGYFFGGYNGAGHGL